MRKTSLAWPAMAMAIALVVVMPASSAADEREAQLERLRTRIQNLQRELNETRDRRDHVREELQAQERRIGALLRSLRTIDARLAEDARGIEELKRRRAKEVTRLQDQSRALEAQLRAAYAMGRQPYLKMLLNQEDPASAARVVTYYRYFNDARLARMREIEETLAHIVELEAKIVTRREALAGLRETEASEKRALEETRKRRASLLANLNRAVSNRTQEIARLKADETRLERLLRELKSYLPEVTAPFPSGRERFARLKGRLPLPFAGRIAARFGETKGYGDLTWRGIFLSGPEGNSVRAVARGRVAYADWLRGFGLLLILDHGDGYMTLYGHNQALYRQVGDWVEAGQPIATVGSTGDAPGTGVYFEIRHNGLPHDPLKWCANTRARR